MNKSIIYIVGGTVLVGGAYLFLKNKKAKDLSKLAELGGTTSGGTTSGGTTSSGTTSGGTTSGGTTSGGTTSSGTTSGGTTSGGVFLPSDKDMKLIDATVLMGKIKDLKAQMQNPKPFVGQKLRSGVSTLQSSYLPSDYSFEYTNYLNVQKSIPIQIEKLLTDLDNLDYALDSNNNLVKLDPNRNKEWIRVQKLYLSLVNLSGTALFFRQSEVLELAKYGYKIDPITKKLVKI